jgi:hypothetical protein
MLPSMDDDWRLMGQERYLKGAAFVRKPYTRWSVDWDHDHCDFCQRKFVEANGHPEDDDEKTVGYAAVGTGPEGQDDYHWVCDDCFADFRERFGWTRNAA